jgi:hypothetical protein
MEVSSQIQVAAPSPHVKSSRYPVDRRLCGLQNWSGRYDVERNLVPLLGIKPGLPIHSLVDVPTELSRFTRAAETESKCQSDFRTRVLKCATNFCVAIVESRGVGSNYRMKYIRQRMAGESCFPDV